MTLATHIIVGAAAASPFLASGDYALAMGVATGSHYIVDMIPHWSVGHHLHSITYEKDKHERTIREPKKLWRDVSLVLLDLFVGIIALIAIVGTPTDLPTLAGIMIVVVGSCLPDGLQFVQFWYKKSPVRQLQTLHDWFHFNTNGKGDLAPTFLTLGSQVALIIGTSFFL